MVIMSSHQIFSVSSFSYLHPPLLFPVPTAYPVDLFEHIWSVDRLQRLGISRFFQPEINECLDYVHRYWTKDGICWARNSRVQDIDDTAMGFRLLRLHGYEVSPVETRLYIEQYGGQDDVWIGKTLYRMPYVNNNVYLELAKLDYNNCQSLHRIEWDNIQKWYEGYNLGGFGVNKRSLLRTYFLTTSNIFEPERSVERLTWTKTAILVQAIASYFENSREERIEFANEFQKFPNTRGYINGR
ncbi:Copalyl diphosphate synthase [Tripterygium wilfordii]|uniref:Copalyl diphosphate synthase n=1 Tax=Tripterygium wilfordii TaxID=458696 RepID=A0A7J7CFB5_TRIWF|nr:Copalyl diphosphate synthase [Tripterygium wilfordii]